MSSTKSVVIGIIIAVLAVALVFFAWKERENTPVPEGISLIATTTPLTVGGAASSAVSAPTYTVKAVPISGSGITPPNYRAPLVISAKMSADQQASLRAQYAADVAAIAKNPSDFDSWIDLGNTRKAAGDYVGAVADWQYMSEAAPTNVVSFANLADLYTNYLPDYPKAAANYLQEIKNSPQSVYIYQDLYTLYTNQYPQSKAAIVALLQKGIAANPNAAELKADLAKEQAK